MCSCYGVLIVEMFLYRVFLVRIFNLYALMAGWLIATEVHTLCVCLSVYVSVCCMYVCGAYCVCYVCVYVLCLSVCVSVCVCVCMDVYP